MHFVDWLIVVCPLVIVVIIGLKAQKYVKGVSDFLAARRVAGRYVIAVAMGEAGMGLVSLIAIFEMYYNSGLAFSFWGTMSAPLGLLMLLTGYCIFRYRETRAMSMGQFLEIRYSKAFRIFAGILQTISGVLNYAIFPAVAARFLIYFCDLPLSISVFGYQFSTFMVVMGVFLGLAVFVATMGGQITVIVTDCVQGILSYPMFAIIVIFILFKYSWFDDIAPPLLDRPAGESMINPFDMSKVRDFNIFFVIVGIISSIINRMSVGGASSYLSSGLNAHEQKMGSVLGVWRNGFSFMMYVLLAIVAFAIFNSPKFAATSEIVQKDLVIKTAQDVLSAENDQVIRDEIISLAHGYNLAADSSSKYYDNEKLLLSSKKIILNDTERNTSSEAHGKSQEFATYYGQMRVPMTLKHILPVGIMGVFCALCVFLLISTDTTILHGWSSVIVQDIILPIRHKAFTPHQQLTLLRIFIVLIALFAFFFSAFIGQVDFILMFFAITGAIWLGGAGICVVGGLYWKRGTTAGAFCALICSLIFAVGGMMLQRCWATLVYPWLENYDMVETVAKILDTLSSPFQPYVQWKMDPMRCPINSQEMFFMTMFLSVSLYFVVSLLTCRRPFNMDRMLHRGKYRREGDVLVIPKLTWRTALTRALGIDSQYTKGDKAIAWSVFLYSMLWCFGSFIVIVIWNKFFGQWPKQWWANWYFIAAVCVPGLIAIVSTVWFTVGGIVDLHRLFRRLRETTVDVRDDGRVISHVNADDVDLVERVNHTEIPQAHCQVPPDNELANGDDL